MTSLNLSMIPAKEKTEGEFKDGTLGIGSLIKFEPFAYYRICYCGEDTLVTLLYRITTDKYFQIVSDRKSFGSKSKMNLETGTNFKSAKIESQYLYDYNLSMEENITIILQRRIESRYFNEGFPIMITTKFLSTSNWIKIANRLLYQNTMLYRSQSSHEIIETLRNNDLNPQPVNTHLGEWVAECPNNIYHRIQINLYNKQWECSFCHNNTQKSNQLDYFLQDKKKQKTSPDWYYNLKNNMNFRNVKFKLLRESQYNLLLDDSYFELVDYNKFIQYEPNCIPLFLKGQIKNFPFMPQSEKELEGQLIGELMKDFRNGVEYSLTIHRVVKGRLELVAYFHRYKRDSLNQRWKQLHSLKSSEKLDAIKNFLKHDSGDFRDT